MGFYRSVLQRRPYSVQFPFVMRPTLLYHLQIHILALH